METKVIYVKVALTIKKSADPQQVVEEVHYDFPHDDIVATEIVDMWVGETDEY